jgi:hypothetical protein
LGPIPILIIPANSNKLVKNVDTNVLFAFLKPFIQELEDTFINGFPISSYVYPGSYISEELIRDKLGGSIKLRTMLMMFIGVDLAQCKVGGLKVGGYSSCRRHFTNPKQQTRGSCA